MSEETAAIQISNCMMCGFLPGRHPRRVTRTCAGNGGELPRVYISTVGGAVEQADGYDITLSPARTEQSEMKLFFLNLGDTIRTISRNFIGMSYLSQRTRYHMAYYRLHQAKRDEIGTQAASTSQT